MSTDIPATVLAVQCGFNGQVIGEASDDELRILSLLWASAPLSAQIIEECIAAQNCPLQADVPTVISSLLGKNLAVESPLSHDLSTAGYQPNCTRLQGLTPGIRRVAALAGISECLAFEGAALAGI